MTRFGWRLFGLSVLVLVLAAGAATGGYFTTRSVRGPGAPSSPPVPAPPSVLAQASTPPSAAASASTPAPAPSAVRVVLTRALAAPGLGGRVRASVVDVASGAVLYNDGGSIPATPASTAKLLTAAAVLSVRSPTYRITTTVRAGSSGAIVLVGAGDPTLTGAGAPAKAAYPEAAQLRELARQLRAAKVAPTSVVIDDSAFSGPTVSPDWAREDVPSDYASAITPVLMDGGRAAPGDTVRSAEPDLATGRRLAELLGRPELPVSRGLAGNGQVLAKVESAPLSTLVAQMLTGSDNVIAECLARQVAIASGAVHSFVGAARAVRAAIRRIAADPGGALVDGSGLAPRDRLAPTALTAVLRTAAGPRAGPLRALIAGLPVAGWSGTLTGRYLSGAAAAAAGLARAKTGTLTGVSSLAGLVHDRGGNLLAFALIADRVSSTDAAESALDAAIASLAQCSCR